MSIFQKSVIQKYLKGLNPLWLNTAYDKFNEIFNPEKIEIIKNLKEEEYQDGFLRDLFVEVLGYTLKPDKNFDIVREFKNQTNSKKADGAILKDKKAVAVIELKSTKTKDLTSITSQAFDYKNNQPGCKYVITSNFQKLRFYVDYANEYEEFDLFNLKKSDFELLYLILRKKSIFENTPQKLKDETRFHEEKISKQLYEDYSNLKNKIFENLVKNNIDVDKLILFKKSQKLLDRLLFIFFAEDCGLLPPNSISRIIDRYELLKNEDAYKPLYVIYKQYFGYMNIGRKGKTPSDDIPAYNGGLFATDELLDNFKIDDKILKADCLKMSAYDFSTEVDVNILGQIFEHSLNEIEKMETELSATAKTRKHALLSVSKRKKDGVFYTPKYITQYIIENTIGILCSEKRKEMNIYEIEFDDSYRTKKGLNKKGKELYNKLNDYKKWLKSLKILDPACGSGAFLNQALQFLITEHKLIDDFIADLTKQKIRLFDTDKSILENNLFGVDINEESVEIAKLSLWLRTAQKGRTLSTLNNNIKCGNSLINDPEIVGNNAFDWNIEFKEIMDNGGFDVIVGNPPYGVKLSNKTKKYLTNFDKLVPDYEIYIYFISLATDYLLKKNGILSYIFPNTFLSILYGKDYRKKIIDKFTLLEVVDLSNDNTFIDASVRTCIFTLQNTSFDNYDISFKKIEGENNKSIVELNKQNNYFLKKHINNWLSISTYTNEIFQIIDKITNSKTINDYFEVSQGYIPYRRSDLLKKYGQYGNEIVDKRLWHSEQKLDENYKQEILGKNLFRYYNSETKSFIKYGKHIASYVQPKFFENNRILIREITGKTLNSNYIDKEFYNNPSLINIIDKNSILNLKYLLTVLNSNLIGWYHNNTSPKAKKGLFPKILINDVRNIPIKEINKNQQQPFITKANEMLLLNKELQTEKNNFLKTLQEEKQLEKLSKKLQNFQELEYDAFKKELHKKKIKINLGDENNEWREYFNTTKKKINELQTQINQTDKEIDKMVYELYELTDEEIEIVEKSVK